jgi:hypothetical protein
MCGRVRRCTRRSCATSSSGQDSSRRAAKKAPLTPTTSRVAETRSGGGWSRPKRLMPASSPDETLAAQKGCAQAPQPKRDDKGCASGLSPHALLFATRSPVRKEKITQIRKINSCRSHQWSRDAWVWSVDDRYRRGRRRIRKHVLRNRCPSASIRLISTGVQVSPAGSVK